MLDGNVVRKKQIHNFTDEMGINVNNWCTLVLKPDFIITPQKLLIETEKATVEGTQLYAWHQELTRTQR